MLIGSRDVLKWLPPLSRRARRRECRVVDCREAVCEHVSELFSSLGSWVRRAVSGDFQRNENLINERGSGAEEGGLDIRERGRERGIKRERTRKLILQGL